MIYFSQCKAHTLFPRSDRFKKEMKVTHYNIAKFCETKRFCNSHAPLR